MINIRCPLITIHSITTLRYQLGDFNYLIIDDGWRCRRSYVPAHDWILTGLVPEYANKGILRTGDGNPIKQ